LYRRRNGVHMMREDDQPIIVGWLSPGNCLRGSAGTRNPEGQRQLIHPREYFVERQAEVFTSAGQEFNFV